MTPLRQRMIEAMQLRGLSARTQESYLAAVQQLAIHYRKSPDLISEEELRQYFLFLCNEKGLAPNTTNVALNGIKFFYTCTLQRPWPLALAPQSHLAVSQHCCQWRTARQLSDG
jgi:hypothetical protein